MLAEHGAVSSGEVAAPVRASLATLAAEINREAGLADEAWALAVQHALRAGELLIQAKAELRHGEWLPWLRDNFERSERTAQLYMALARNPQRVAGLSLRAAAAIRFADQYEHPESNLEPEMVALDPESVDHIPTLATIRPTMSDEPRKTALDVVTEALVEVGALADVSSLETQAGVNNTVVALVRLAQHLAKRIDALEAEVEDLQESAGEAGPTPNGH
jgi:hypothetical protein